MKSKKIYIIIAVVFVLILGTLVAAPYLFRNKIKELILKSVNDSVTAKVAFSDVDLSFFSSFPQVSVKLKELSIINNAPFEKDTLTYVKELALEMPIRELFKSSGEPISISGIIVNDAYLSLKTDKNGAVNYDIMKPTDEKSSNEKAMVFDIKNYEIINGTLIYLDETSDMKVVLKDFNHSGSGDFSAEKSNLGTKSSAKLSFSFNGVNYFENSELVLDALIAMDLQTNTYSFLKNEGTVNGLPLTFDGKVVLLEAGQQVDISFKTPTSSFKNFLAVMPKEYASKIDDVKTEGDFIVNGYFKGENNDLRIPGFEINISSNNASFKYPDLPKAVNDITIKTLIKNETGLTKDTYANIDALNFRIDKDVFTSNAKIINLTTNPFVNAALKGTINLANISNAYPFKLEEKISGVLKMDFSTMFDMEAVEKSNYARIKSKGDVSLSNFIYASKEFNQPFNISKAAINFSPEKILLKEFSATTGKTDINATGTLLDVIAFVVSNKPLKGNFNLTSNVFSVNDFMSNEVPKNEESNKVVTPLKIPSFLDCTISAKANTVLYDNLTLKDVNGIMVIKDETVSLKQVKSSLFGGTINMEGAVSTKSETPSFNLNLGINSFNIADSFKEMELLTALAPIAAIIQGKLNTTLNFSGNLGQDFTPVLTSVSGDALAEILSDKMNVANSPLLNMLTGQLKFLDAAKLDLSAIKTKVSFENGKVNVKPFTVKYKDIDITISGNHGFDKTMDYKATFIVPGKYLGNEITGLMARMNTEDVSKIRIPITANITGSFSKPNVVTDYKSSVSSLATQLVDYNKLKSKGSAALNDIINKAVKPTDTTSAAPKVDVTKPKEAVTNLVKGKLEGLLGTKKKKKDTVN